MSYTPKKTPLEKHAERFIRDYPRGVYKTFETTTTASKKKSTVKQVRSPRPLGHKKTVKTVKKGAAWRKLK